MENAEKEDKDNDGRRMKGNDFAEAEVVITDEPDEEEEGCAVASSTVPPAAWMSEEIQSLTAGETPQRTNESPDKKGEENVEEAEDAEEAGADEWENDSKRERSGS